MDKFLLSQNEIKQITARKHHSAQRAVLNTMGISHKVRPDGSLVVLRVHFYRMMGSVLHSEKVEKSSIEPNWDSLK